jgi:hypothetical protein
LKQFDFYPALMLTTPFKAANIILIAFYPALNSAAYRKWALLVGNCRYEGKPLLTTLPDCQRIAATLTTHGFRSLQHGSATHASLSLVYEYF